MINVDCCDESRRECFPTITTTSITGGRDRFEDVVLMQLINHYFLSAGSSSISVVHDIVFGAMSQ